MKRGSNVSYHNWQGGKGEGGKCRYWLTKEGGGMGNADIVGQG